MKVSKRQLRRIIKEEKTKILLEQPGLGQRIETGVPLIEFARAYMGLGDAVASQVDAVVAAFKSGGPDSEEFIDTVRRQNMHSLDIALEKLPLDGSMDSDEDLILDALDSATLLFRERG
tara:strand:- start:36 stop:392 length:357 start_codon:yes stop_codon:yes gene_type:complete